MTVATRLLERVAPLIVVGILVMLSTGLGLFHLGEKSFWWDEGHSVGFARLNPADAFRFERGNMALYYLFLHVWLRLGESEAVIRSLSVLWAVATVPVAYALGARLLGRAGATTGVFLLVINAFFVRYAQEARAYSLLTFLSTLSFSLFVRSVVQPSGWTWTGYVVSSALAVYSHGFAILNLPAQWASLAFLRRRQIPWRPLAASTGAIALLLLPLAAAVVGGRLGRPWIPRPTYSDLVRVFGSLSGQGGIPLLSIYFFSLLGAALSGLNAWRSSGPSIGVWRYSVLLAWLFVPVGLAFAFSQRTPLLVDRYLIGSMIPLTLLAGVGIVRLRPRWAAAAVLVVLVGLTVRATVSYYTAYQKEDWRSVTRFIASQWKPADGIFFWIDGGSRATVAYYQSRLGTHIDPQAMPAESAWDRDLRPYRRVWLVLSHDRRGDRPNMTQAIRATLSQRFSSMEEYPFTGILVALYSGVVEESGYDMDPASRASRRRQI